MSVGELESMIVEVRGVYAGARPDREPPPDAMLEAGVNGEAAESAETESPDMATFARSVCSRLIACGSGGW